MSIFKHYRIRVPRVRDRVAITAVMGLVCAAGLAYWNGETVSAQSAVLRFVGPISSQPLALTANDAFLAAVNPDNNSVSFFDVRNDRNRKLAEVPVQTEPNGVIMLPNGSKAFVANTVSGTVSVLPLNIANGLIGQPYNHIPVGTEPYSLVLTPNGRKLYVANARGNSISVIDTITEAVVKTIPNVGFEPRGLAVTNDGDSDDGDEQLIVTQFLSLTIPGKLDGNDDAKAGHITVIETLNDTVVTDVVINPLADSGFKARGDAIGRIAPGPDPIHPTGVYPNQLNNVGIKGDFAFLPNTGAAPNGPDTFDVNTHSLMSSVNLNSYTDSGRTVNMHLAVAQQTNPEKLFLTVPWAMAFEHDSNEGFVVSAASDIVFKVLVNPGTGATTVQNDPTDPSRVLQLKVGKNPRGIVINSTDTRAYVMNYISRDITVLSLANDLETVLLASMRSSALPALGTPEDRIHVGKELYNSSVGTFDPPNPFAAPVVGRMSRAGWGSCAACHPFGLSDQVVWIFGSGPRRVIPQHHDFDPSDLNRTKQRALNWSAIFDEEADFESNIRNTSGGLGMIVLADGVTQDPAFNAFNPPNEPRNQLRLRGVKGWDGIKAFVQFGIRTPISPISKTETQVLAGEALFRAANCQQCHGGALWTKSLIRFTPPPPAGITITDQQIVSELVDVETFDPDLATEVRNNAAPARGALGFNPPSLLSLHTVPNSFLHNGTASSLEVVLQNVKHRSAGTGGADTLTNPADRTALARFLLSIDANTPPIPLP